MNWCAHVLCGGLAVGAHGHLRATVDVGLLMTRDGLARFKQRWLGIGRLERFKGSKGMKDADFDVKVDVLTAGEFPGDGKPGPIAFPDPEGLGVEPGGMWQGTRIISLLKLIELKLASGLTALARVQDFADVVALIRANRLGRDFSDHLHEHACPKFVELWESVQALPEEP